MYSERSDSVTNASKFAEIEDLRLAYETEKKDEKIRTIKIESDLKDQRNQRTRNQWILSVIALGLLIVILALVNNRRLLKKKKELAENQILHQQEVIRATINGQEEERKRVAQELHDGIGQQFTAIRLALESGKVNTDETQNKVTGLVSQTAEEVRRLSHQMMPKTLQELGVGVAIKDLVNSIASEHGPKVEFISRKMDGRLEEAQEINIYRICQELLNNAIKHSEAETIDVMLYKAEKHILLVVSDNGKGF